jgi:hypothetical protein
MERLKDFGQLATGKININNDAANGDYFACCHLYLQNITIQTVEG